MTLCCPGSIKYREPISPKMSPSGLKSPARAISGLRANWASPCSGRGFGIKSTAPSAVTSAVNGAVNGAVATASGT